MKNKTPKIIIVIPSFEIGVRSDRLSSLLNIIRIILAGIFKFLVFLTQEKYLNCVNYQR